jgi:hypothetical protein
MDKLKAFAKFAATKPADERYQFMDCTGKCAVGQWMKATGTKWDMEMYQNLVREMFHAEPGKHAALTGSETWGQLSLGLKDRIDA